ncbi:calcineurin-like phosphoesterase family protein [Thalassoglobus sp. JC818]|uniref:calcineurin-like phosphoesterase family protein n=1 Tax=Thalassoglobus sp. JC818 TaxID=3232136 RepID=UPI00345A22EB
MARLLLLTIVTGVLLLSLMLVSLPGETSVSLEDTPPTAKGLVFHDKNGNGVADPGEPGLEGVRVSNGSDIVATNSEGRYELPISSDTTLFVIKPRNWRTPLNELNLPQFYYHHKPIGSPKSKYPGVLPTGPLPKSVDFAMTPQEEPENFKAIMFGDTQPRNQKEVDYIAHDVIEELIGTDAAFGVTLGDIVFNDLGVMPAMNKTVALLGIPWYNVVGNHDINMDAPSRKLANETFEHFYGPSYYSFDYGPVHFIVVDDIEWVVPQGDGRSTYRGGIGPEQLKFIETDLAQIPEDQMVVLMMHIPIIGVHDRHDLYRLIEQRPLCISISGHTHHHEHVWITDVDGWNGPKPHHHIINVTVCGSWWRGTPDERGIPHATMADGAPNGYSILNFDGNDYKLDYYAASRGSNYQMEMDAPEVVTPDNSHESLVYANVFNGDQHTTVKMRVADGEWIEMDHAREIDPKYLRTYQSELKILEKNAGLFTEIPQPKASTHLWKANLPASLPLGTHRIHIQAVDRHGRQFDDSRIIRVEE